MASDCMSQDDGARGTDTSYSSLDILLLESVENAFADS